MESIVHNVRDIADSQKHWIEEKLGYPLQEHQLVMIRVLSPGVEPSEEVRRHAMDNLQAAIREANQGPAARCSVAEEADAAIEEAIQHARRQKS